MSRLHDLFDHVGQSPWLDNPTWPCLSSGRIATWVDKGIRGVTATPVLVEQSLAYATARSDHRAKTSATARLGAEDLFWELTITDMVSKALACLRSLYESSEGRDGYAVIGLPPGLAKDAEGTATSARALHQQIRQPNLMVAIPASDAGITAIHRATAEGMSASPTLIFSLQRYEQVIEAYISGLEVCPGDLSGVNSVAAFSLGELDIKVDAALGRMRAPEALRLRGQVACAFAKAAYQLFRERFRGPRWDNLVHRGANVQRPLWVTDPPSTRWGHTCYSEQLIGTDTISTMSEEVLAAFEDHGRVEPTLERHTEEAAATLRQLRELGVDLDLLAADLEDAALQSRNRSYERVLAALAAGPNPTPR